jgi:mono/diheme cytochrome c family protein
LAVLAAACAQVSSGGRGRPPWQVPAAESAEVNPLAREAAEEAVGLDLFDFHCADCHGPSGRGDGPDAAWLRPRPPDLTAPDIISQSDGALRWKIATGRGGMPGYAEDLPDADLWRLVLAVNALAPRP